MHIYEETKKQAKLLEEKRNAPRLLEQARTSQKRKITDQQKTNDDIEKKLKKEEKKRRKREAEKLKKLKQISTEYKKKMRNRFDPPPLMEISILFFLNPSLSSWCLDLVSVNSEQKFLVSAFNKKKALMLWIPLYIDVQIGEL